jgi:hypothetical protein
MRNGSTVCQRIWRRTPLGKQWDKLDVFHYDFRVDNILQHELQCIKYLTDWRLVLNFGLQSQNRRTHTDMEVRCEFWIRDESNVWKQHWDLKRIAQWYSARLRAGWSGVRVPAEAKNFSLHHRVQIGSGTHTASYPWGQSGPGVKLTIHLHVVPRSKNEWSYNSIPPTRLHGVMFS